MEAPKGISRTGGILLGLGVLFLLFQVMGMLFPIEWWGIHGLAYLPLPLSVFFLIASAVWVLSPRSLPELPRFKWAKNRIWPVPLALACLVSVFFYSFPIHNDPYGDAVNFADDFNEYDKGNMSVRPDYILNPNVFHAKNGEHTVLNLVAVIRMAFDLDTQHAFMVFDTICGFFFIFLWGMFIFRYFEPGWLRSSVLFIISTAPFLQVFFGHIEVYAPTMLMVSSYAMVLVHYLQTRTRRWLIVLGVLLFICLKLHSSSFLLLPSFGFALIEHRKTPEGRKWINFRNILLFVMLPAFIGGIVLYFIILKDHVDPRYFVEGVNIMDRIFLPLFSPDPPYDRYNLLSWNHIWDYFNLIFLWSAGAFKVLLGVVLLHRKEVNWRNPALLLIGMSLFLYTVFFFFVNPLLGTPLDWDLLSLTAPLFLMFVVLLVHNLRNKETVHRLVTGAAAISLLGISVFWVNAEEKASSQRLEDIGIHTFETYWLGSVKAIWRSWEPELDDPEKLRERSEATLARLRKSALPNNDQEMAVLLQSIAKHYRKEVGDFVKAESLHREAIHYALPEEKSVHYLGLMESLFLQGKYKDAYAASLPLVESAFPSAERAEQIALHCALKAGMQEEARIHLGKLRVLNPKDPTLKEMIAAQDSGASTPELLSIFEGAE